MERDGPTPPLLEDYRALCERTRDHEGLAWCIGEELGFERDPERRQNLLLEGAALKRDKLDDRPGAIECLEKAWTSAAGSFVSEGSLWSPSLSSS